MKPGSQHKDVCRSGGWGFCTQDVTEDCIEFWEGQGFEDSSKNTANELCKCEGINLYDHSLRIKIGREKRIKIMDFSWENRCDRRDQRQLFGQNAVSKARDKCSGLVHWEDPKEWDGEGGGRRDQDGEHM